MAHFRGDDIPHVWHRLNAAHRTTALQDFMETPHWHAFAQSRAYDDIMHVHPARIPESKIAYVREPRPRRLTPQLASIISQVGREGTSVTSTSLQQYTARYCICTRY
jgi:hypothetical protein